MADQLLQLVVDRGRAHAFLTQAFRLGLREDANKTFPPGLRPHFVEIPGKTGRYIIKPHDQLGDIGVHRIRVGVHIFQRRVLDINAGIRARGHLLAGRFNPRGQLGNLGLGLGDLSLAFTDLGVEIGHGAPLEVKRCNIQLGRG